MRACSVASVVSDSVTPWTVACQAPLSMGFSRQEYWSGLPFPPPGDLPDRVSNLQVDSLPSWTTWKAHTVLTSVLNYESIKRAILSKDTFICTLLKMNKIFIAHIEEQYYNLGCSFDWEGKPSPQLQPVSASPHTYTASLLNFLSPEPYILPFSKLCIFILSKTQLAEGLDEEFGSPPHLFLNRSP